MADDTRITRFTLCCGGRRCPEVTINSDICNIVDDDKNSVTFTVDQLKLLAKHCIDMGLVSD